MRPTDVASDARPVPSIAEQLRAARQHHERRRRVIVGMLLAVSAAFPAARLVADASPEHEGARFPASATTPTAPNRSSVPAGLDPGLVGALRRATAEAADAGHNLTITSGFRTAEEQAAMLDAEVAKRGALEAARWWG